MTPAFTYEVEAVHDEDDGSISMCNECDADYWGSTSALLHPTPMAVAWPSGLPTSHAVRMRWCSEIF